MNMHIMIDETILYRREILKYMNSAFKHYCLTSFCTTKFVTLILRTLFV